MIIIRQKPTHAGTFGILLDESLNEVAKTIELPWYDNKVDISCIPEGTYEMLPYISHYLGQCFRIPDVHMRTNIRMHTGNWAGDKSLGLRSDVEGCILIGEEIGHLYGQPAVLNSRGAMRKLHNLIQDRTPLRIVWENSNTKRI